MKPYECRVCQKRFFRKDHLAEHFTTHTKTLPYHCPICNRGFQRQIAMRAHFQNEHVGQHDLVKTCPLCSYRAGTMKSLRIHFFNRHGIDLDNPGPNAPSSLLLALDPMNAGNYLPSIALAAAAAAVNAGNSSLNSLGGNSNSGGGGPTYSDSGESLRSADNGTPPMHFLTPHVEISMADNDSFKVFVGSIIVCLKLKIVIHVNVCGCVCFSTFLDRKFTNQCKFSIRNPALSIVNDLESSVKWWIAITAFS